jgi:hypothetical protein
MLAHEFARFLDRLGSYVMDEPRKPHPEAARAHKFVPLPCQSGHRGGGQQPEYNPDAHNERCG